MTTVSLTLRPARRATYGAASILLFGAVLALAIATGAGFWQVVVFAAAPDLTLLVGASGETQPGQLHPRAVGAYNLAHRLWGPVAMVAATLAVSAGAGWVLGGLTWALHVTFDRALGYGLRTPTGFQRS